MRNTGLLLVLIGIFIFLNVLNFVDVLNGTSKLSFLNPKTASTANTTKNDLATHVLASQVINNA